MAQLLVDLPDELVQRLERTVPARQRNGFVQRLIEEALPPEVDDDDLLYQTALAVERDEALNAEMAEWEQATAGDGLDGRP
jgi:hypothetical protein